MPCLGGASKNKGLLEVTFFFFRRVWHIPRQRFIYFVIKTFQGQSLTKQTDVSSIILCSWGCVFRGELCCLLRARRADRSLLCSWEKRKVHSLSLSFFLFDISSDPSLFETTFCVVLMKSSFNSLFKSAVPLWRGDCQIHSELIPFSCGLKSKLLPYKIHEKYSYPFFPSPW